MPVLTFDEFIPAKQSAAGKMMPPKARAGSTTFALNKGVVDLIEHSLGTLLDCETKTEQNGKYTNHFIVSAKHVAATAPESAPTKTSPPSPTEAVVTPAASPSYPGNERERLIVRQSSLKAAVDWANANGLTAPDVLAIADSFVDWVYKTDPQKNSASRTAAQSTLQDIREKLADIRAEYSDEDAVCPNCGRKEFLKQWSGGWFCARSKEAGTPGGCGAPPKGERMDTPATYGEWRARTATTSVPWQ